MIQRVRIFQIIRDSIMLTYLNCTKRIKIAHFIPYAILESLINNLIDSSKSIYETRTLLGPGR